MSQLNEEKTIQHFDLNFGPQHPAAHGVLRLLLSMDGEVVFGTWPHIGLLHRGTEKLLEERPSLELIPYFDRMDYVSMMASEYTISLMDEKNSGEIPSNRAQAIRVLFLEITRILNHLMAVTTHAMDVGALTPFLWCFEEREILMEFYERVSGARMHAIYIRPGGVSFDIPVGLIADIYSFVVSFSRRLDEVEELLTSNRIWKQRLYDVAYISEDVAKNMNLSGVMLRGSGIEHDLRKEAPYELYSTIDFLVPVGRMGDCFDRYVVRLEEMRQSIKIIKYTIDTISAGLVQPRDTKVSLQSRDDTKKHMESLINHYKSSLGLGSGPRASFDSVSTEAPKGEFMVSGYYTPEGKLVRCKTKPPGFYHLQSTSIMTNKHLIADVVTVIGTQDIVFGEVDR